MATEKLKRIVQTSPAYDKRHPEPSKNYGIGAVRIWFVVSGRKGAISVSFWTNWYLPSTVEEYKTKGVSGRIVDLEKDNSKPIQSGSWDYHAVKKTEEWQTKHDDCNWLNKKKACYSDGSYTKAEPYLKLLLEGGSEEVFKQLEKDYHVQFKGVREPV